MFFACSGEHDEIMGNNISSDDIQIVDGMLVFSSHRVLSDVISKGGFCADYVSVFKSQKQMFEEVVAAESKQMDYLDGLSGEELEKAPKHTALYETALKDGVIKEICYKDGATTYVHNLCLPYYASVLNKDGFFAVGDTLYQITDNYFKFWAGTSIDKKEVLAASIISDKTNNIFVFDREMLNQTDKTLSRVSFPAPPSSIKVGMYANYPDVGYRFTISYIDLIGLALPKYTRDFYVHFTSQRLVNGTNSYGYMPVPFLIRFSIRMQVEEETSSYEVSVSGASADAWYTIYPAFKALIEGKIQLETDEPYIYVLNIGNQFVVDYEQGHYFGGFFLSREDKSAKEYSMLLFDDDHCDGDWLEEIIL